MKQKNENLKEYQTLKMPLVQLMFLVAALGVALTIVLHYFF